MKNRLSIVLLMCFALSFSAVAVGIEKQAIQSASVFVVDGEEVSFDLAYNIDGNNYVSLREVAKALSGSNAQFNVYWDEETQRAIVDTGKAYTGEPSASVDTNAEDDDDWTYTEGTNPNSDAYVIKTYETFDFVAMMEEARRIGAEEGYVQGSLFLKEYAGCNTTVEGYVRSLRDGGFYISTDARDMEGHTVFVRTDDLDFMLGLEVGDKVTVSGTFDGSETLNGCTFS